jgi:hypothetical protein
LTISSIIKLQIVRPEICTHGQCLVCVGIQCAKQNKTACLHGKCVVLAAQQLDFGGHVVQREELVGKKRNKEIANARHIAIYLIREITEMSYPNISKIFDRDHATIMASIEVVKKRISSDAIYSMDIEGLKKEICGN